VLRERGGRGEVRAQILEPFSSSRSDRQYPRFERMADIADRVVGQIGLEHTTFNIEFLGLGHRRADLVEVNPRHSQSHAELFAQVDFYVGAADEPELTEKYQRCVEALPFEIDDEEMSTV
jgi:hypothetical protein